MFCLSLSLQNNVTYAGAISGDIYMFKEVTLSRVIPKAHQGPIFSMFTTLSDGLIVTGAKEKMLVKLKKLTVHSNKIFIN